MTLRANLDEHGFEETGETLSWRAWLLVPLLVLSLVGIVVPLTHENPSQPPPGFTFQEEQEDLVPYHGELERLIGRLEISPRARAVIERLHKRLSAFAERHKGRIRQSDRHTVDRFLDTYR